MSRRALPLAQKKSERLSVALSPEEHNRVCLMALKLRMDVSEYIRLMVIPEAVNVLMPNIGSETNQESA